MTTDAQNTAILEKLKPEVSIKFWCANCQIERYVADRRERVLDLKGRMHKVVGCIYCKTKKLK